MLATAGKTLHHVFRKAVDAADSMTRWEVTHQVRQHCHLRGTRQPEVACIDVFCFVICVHAKLAVGTATVPIYPELHVHLQEDAEGCIEGTYTTLLARRKVGSRQSKPQSKHQCVGVMPQSSPRHGPWTCSGQVHS